MAQRSNPALVFVAILVAAVIIIFAIVNRNPAPGGEGPSPADEPPAALPEVPAVDPDDAAGPAADTVTTIDQTTDTTAPPDLPPPAETESGEGEGTEPTLFSAAAAGDAEAITARAAEGEALDARDPEGRTALMIAAREGQIAAVFALLNAGADASLRDPERRAARDYALARFDDSGRTIARLLEDAIGPAPVTNPVNK